MLNSRPPDSFCAKHGVHYDSFSDLECPQCTIELKPKRDAEHKAHMAAMEKREAEIAKEVAALNDILLRRTQEGNRIDRVIEWGRSMLIGSKSFHVTDEEIRKISAGDLNLFEKVTKDFCDYIRARGGMPSKAEPEVRDKTPEDFLREAVWGLDGVLEPNHHVKLSIPVWNELKQTKETLMTELSAAMMNSGPVEVKKGQDSRYPVG